MEKNIPNNLEEKRAQIIKAFQKRINYLLLIALILFILIIIRLSYIQIIQGEHYSQKALSRSDKHVIIPAMRGRIFPREGHKPIVYNRPSPTAVFTEMEKMKKDDLIKLSVDLEKVLKISRVEILKKMDVGFVYKVDKNGNIIYDKNGKPTFETTIRNSHRFTEKDIKNDLTDKEIAYLSEHHLDFPGISVQTKPIRVYDSRRIAVQTIGYVRPYNIVTSAQNSLTDIYQQKDEEYMPNQLVGFEGVELSYEDQLHGKNGKRYFTVDASGKVQSDFYEIPPKPGNDIYLTIDSRMQVELRDFIHDYLPQIRKMKDAGDTKSIYAVAMEVKTGKIVAMLSYPEYDPNLWIKGMDQKVYDEIKYYVPNGTIQSAPYDVSPKKGAAALEEIEKHPQSIVPSGSTIKPATMLMGLAEKVIHSHDVWYDPPGGYRYGSGRDVVRNDHNHNYGTITPQIALQKSSNTYMARIGKLINDKYNQYSIYILQKYFHALGLGVKTGVPLPFENSGIQDFVATNRNISSLAAMVQASFGQQERYTAMQLCQYAATIANRGKRLQPQIVDKIVDPTGKIVEKVAPKVMNQLNVPDEIWDTIEEGMYMVTQPHGTAYAPFKGFPYRVAAKTGTSDQDIYIPVINSKGEKIYRKYNSVANGVFIAYAPVENPKLAVSIVIPQGGYGGKSCGGIARKIFEIYDKYYGLK